jgi:hypothetical protein
MVAFLQESKTQTEYCATKIELFHSEFANKYLQETDIDSIIKIASTHIETRNK